MADAFREKRPIISLGRPAKAKVEGKPRGWLVILDYVYFVLLGLAIVGFVYYLFFFRDLALLYLPVFLQATVITLIISLISVVFAILFGLLGAFGRLSRFPVIRAIASVYVEVIRGTPILVQMLLWYYGVGGLLSKLGFDPYSIVYQWATALSSNSLVPDALNGYFYGVIALSFNYGAYLTEVFRTGIQSVDKGQSEAALSLGFNARQVMRQIVLPQAIRITIPPFTNYFITLIQDSALLSTLSVVELEHTTYSLALPQIDSNDKLFVFIFGALFYLILCYPLSLLARYLESRLAKAY